MGFSGGQILRADVDGGATDGTSRVHCQRQVFMLLVHAQVLFVHVDGALIYCVGDGVVDQFAENTNPVLKLGSAECLS